MQAINLILENQIAFTAVAAIFSLMVGSFLNVVIYRLPVMLENAWRAELNDYVAQGDAPTASNIAERSTTTGHELPGEQNSKAFNLSTPRSRCPECDHPIGALENIPVFSYLALKGKCKACRAPISWRYPAIEALTALLCSFIAWQMFANPVAAVAAITLTWTLIALTWIDYDTYLLPDNITLPLVWAGLIVNYFGLFTTLESALWGAVAGYLILWSVFWLFKFVTGKEGMGYGDFKLLAALGAWLGWEMLPAIILLSSLVGATIGIAMIAFANHEKSKPIPFGPYLAIAGWIALVWGQQINQAYLHYMGLA